jgi:hypothetical protein
MPSPSVLYGFSRVLDLFGRGDRFNDSPTPEAADRAGLRCDWEMIKGDLAKARQLLVAQDPEARDVVKALESVESHVIHNRVRLGGSPPSGIKCS